MKRYFNILSCALCAIALLSCEKEVEVPETPEDGTVPPGYILETLTGVSEQTKTTIDNGVTLWAADDQIKVICSDNSASNFTIQSGAGSNTGDFQGLVPEGKTAVYAVYPAALYSSVSGSTVKVTIPASQTGVFGAGNLAVAKVDADDHSMAFKNVNAFISFTIPSGITKVVISSVDGSDLAGTLSIDCSGDAPAAGAVESGASSVTTTFPDANGGTYYISVAPGVTHTKGLLLTYYKMVENVETESGNYYLNKTILTAANVNIVMGTVEAEGNYYVTVNGAGNKNGMSWENAFSATQMWKKLHLAGTDSETGEPIDAASDAAKIAAINGATFYMGAGTYDFGENPTLSFNESDAVTLTFKGGYNASTGVRNLETNATVITGADSHHCLILSDKMNVTLDGLQFTHGKVSGDSDGALSCSKSSLYVTMTDCVISNNTGAGNNGGGMLAKEKCHIDATRVKFANNTGKVAPALLCMNSNLTFTDCDFEQNHSINWCGAVRVRQNSPSATFTNCRFVNNSATNDSGCFVHSEGTVTFNNCEFTENTGGGNGGAFTANGNVTTNFKGATTFTGNEAHLGGAIYTSGSSTININISENCVFSGNHATGWAGAIHFKSKGSLNVTDCTFSGNYGDGDSGAFNADNASATFTFNEVTFSGNHSDSDNGGVMWISDGTYSFNNCLFQNNYSNGNGGVIYSEKSGDVSITGCTFQGNHTTCRQNSNDEKNGGALYVHGAPTVKIKSSHFNDNYAGIGGSIYANKNGDNYPLIFLNACSFSGNYVQYRYGTAINIDNASYFCMNNCSFANNHYVNYSSGTDGLKPSWVALDGIQNCSVISNCSLIGRTWRKNGDDLSSANTNNALIGLWDATKTYLINDLVILDTNGSSLSPVRGNNEDPQQQVVAHYTHYTKDNINIDWSGDHNVKGYWKEHTRYGNGDDEATWDDNCWKWNGYYVKNGSTIDGYDKITKSDFTGYLTAACPAFVTWLGADIYKDQLGNERGINGWWPGAFQSQPGAEPVILQAITWNIRSSDMDDTGDHAWSARRGGMAAFINDRKPHIVCMQECEEDQRTYLTGNCSGYSAVYDNTSMSWWQQWQGVEHSGEVILYRTSDISVQSSGTFWLVSSAPTSPSRSSDQNSYRSCTWMKCTYNGQKMLVMDVHLSYRTRNNSTPGSDDVIALRQTEMGVIKTWIDGHYNPASDGWLLFMGDMNTSHWEAIFDEWKDGTYGYFSRDGFTGGALGRTYNDWDWENGHVSTIDFQFYKGFPSVKSYTIPTATYSDVAYLSDHWPVVVEYYMN